MELAKAMENAIVISDIQEINARPAVTASMKPSKMKINCCAHNATYPVMADVQALEPKAARNAARDGS